LVTRAIVTTWQDTRAHAEAAKDELDLSKLNGRQLRVRFALHASALRLKELSPYVSNELLEHVSQGERSSRRAPGLLDRLDSVMHIPHLRDDG